MSAKRARDDVTREDAGQKGRSATVDVNSTTRVICGMVSTHLGILPHQRNALAVLLVKVLLEKCPLALLVI
jgi:hypothetical protein